MEKLEVIRLCFCDKKRILEIIVLSAKGRISRDKGGEKALARERISGITESILHDILRGLKIFLRLEIKKLSPEKKPAVSL